MPRIAPRTFQRHQKYLSAPLDHAVAEGILPKNPFKQFVLGEKAISAMRRGLPETTRKLWHDEFQQLLATEAWTSDKTAITDPIYWVPLIARLSGMRSEEILQLKPANIRSLDGVYYFEIERGTGQSVKSENGKRLVPIHSQLLELGFLELVAHQRRLAKRRIFDTIQRARTKKNTYAEIMNGRFEYYRKRHDVYERRLDLHGLRTTFNSECVALAVPDTARRYLMGHQNPDVGIVNYLPEGFPITTLKYYIEMQRIDISSITRRFRAEDQYPPGPRLAAVGGRRLTG
ncbi:MAG: tyrosine-type recombinase/integrase [Paracoccus sp. (in: a-proteobacteria)]|uniref:tyrosine-type recombinase/integrase n=1 Tax=Paracoccus sp. TaxID=267 RepID=UPI0026DEF3EE|nr:tyrosine-type recombinase/integrase [Paracoccus sp. (in: a-proteobacteria)]MDO5622994.1 tyrosine-type recombinase/integrase [Paracoccus sp. (in: a-proteobacteria)]